METSSNNFTVYADALDAVIIATANAYKLTAEELEALPNRADVDMDEDYEWMTIPTFREDMDACCQPAPLRIGHDYDLLMFVQGEADLAMAIEHEEEERANLAWEREESRFIEWCTMSDSERAECYAHEWDGSSHRTETPSDDEATALEVMKRAADATLATAHKHEEAYLAMGSDDNPDYDLPF